MNSKHYWLEANGRDGRVLVDRKAIVATEYGDSGGIDQTAIKEVLAHITLEKYDHITVNLSDTDDRARHILCAYNGPDGWEYYQTRPDGAILGGAQPVKPKSDTPARFVYEMLLTIPIIAKWERHNAIVRKAQRLEIKAHQLRNELE